MSNNQKRVFKTRTFDHWAKKVIPDGLLCAAAREIEQGLFEADLGGGVCKKRVALPGAGKSGATRTLVAKRSQFALFFLVGREKSGAGTDFTTKEELAAKGVAKALQAADTSMLDRLAGDGALKEICRGKSN